MKLNEVIYVIENITKINLDQKNDDYIKEFFSKFNQSLWLLCDVNEMDDVKAMKMFNKLNNGF